MEEHFSKKGQFTLATKLLNGAFAYTQEDAVQDFQTKQNIYKEIVNIEKYFLEQVCKISSDKLSLVNANTYIEEKN